MDNFTNLQNEFRKFYTSAATAQVLKEELARLLAKSENKSYTEVINGLDLKIKARIKKDSVLQQESD